MKTGKSKLFRIYTIAILVVMVVVFGCLVSKKVVRSGSVTYNWNVNNANHFIQGLYPEGRVEWNKDILEVKHEPVYFELYAPAKFNRAEITVDYLLSPGLTAQLGMKLGITAWGFYMYDLPGTNGDWKQEIIEVDLGQSELINNKLKFVIAAPGIDEEVDKFLIKNIKAKLIK
jgi:hypothetical protein